MRILALDDARQSKQSLLEAVRLGSSDAAVYDFSEPEPMLEFARVNPCEAVFVRLPMRQGDGMAIARAVLEYVSDKRRLRQHMGHADESVMNQVDSAIAVSFGLPNTTT